MGPILRVQKRVQKNRAAAAARNVQCLVQTGANFAPCSTPSYLAD